MIPNAKPSWVLGAQSGTGMCLLLKILFFPTPIPPNHRTHLVVYYRQSTIFAVYGIFKWNTENNNLTLTLFRNPNLN